MAKVPIIYDILIANLLNRDISFMRQNKKYLIIPIFIFLSVLIGTSIILHDVATGNTLVFSQPTTLAEYNSDIIKLLLWLIGIVGTGFILLLIYMFKMFINKIEGISIKLTSIDLRCIAFHPELLINKTLSETIKKL